MDFGARVLIQRFWRVDSGAWILSRFYLPESSLTPNLCYNTQFIAPKYRKTAHAIQKAQTPNKAPSNN
ncbi:hypothetical protein BKN38_07015 [Helicobacter sp. CLO-3]|nr:hypothetical protein BA723_01650 [Helicobacter sp. CLO-3]OHU82517.1 hypothetical protein BKN38_07015 [Helicobacter sp. CLO-3]